MMVIFFTKYAVGVILARRFSLSHEAVFAGLVSICYGFLSGLFLARAIVIWRSAANSMSDTEPRGNMPHIVRR